MSSGSRSFSVRMFVVGVVLLALVAGGVGAVVTQVSSAAPGEGARSAAAYPAAASAMLPAVMAQPAPTAVPPTPPPSANSQIVNGNFERGPDGSWLEFSLNGWRIILQEANLPVDAHSGTWAIWLGGDYDEIGGIEQQVTVPAAAPYLTYWHWIASQDSCNNDFAGTIIDRTTVVDAYTLCGATTTEGWTRHVIDLRAYAGQSVAVQIRAETNATLNSNVFIDDVSFQSRAALMNSPAVRPSRESIGLAQLVKGEPLAARDTRPEVGGRLLGPSIDR